MALSVAAVALQVSSTLMTGTRSATGIAKGLASEPANTIDNNTMFMGLSPVADAQAAAIKGQHRLVSQEHQR
jgi:hypothetical protein